MLTFVLCIRNAFEPVKYRAAYITYALSAAGHAHARARAPARIRAGKKTAIKCQDFRFHKARVISGKMAAPVKAPPIYHARRIIVGTRRNPALFTVNTVNTGWTRCRVTARLSESPERDPPSAISRGGGKGEEECLAFLGIRGIFAAAIAPERTDESKRNQNWVVCFTCVKHTRARNEFPSRLSRIGESRARISTDRIDLSAFIIKMSATAHLVDWLYRINRYI